MAFSSFVPPVPPCGMVSACDCGSLHGPAARQFGPLPLVFVGALHAHIVLFRFTDFLDEAFPAPHLPEHPGPHGKSLEGGFFLSSSASLVVALPVLGSTVFCRTCFLQFRLCSIRFCSSPICFADQLFQCWIRAFLVCKLQRRFPYRIPATRIRWIQQHTGFRIY